jgi:PAS domain S-box-containing protein
MQIQVFRNWMLNRGLRCHEWQAVALSPQNILALANVLLFTALRCSEPDIVREPILTDIQRLSPVHHIIPDTSNLGDLVRAFDWSTTSLGQIVSWPQSLRSAVNFILGSQTAIVMLWGDDGIMIYNDAYSQFAGKRHPALLGSHVREGWPEVADFNDNVMKVCLSGRSLFYRNRELTLYRQGEPAQVWMDLSYSPLYDEAGKPAGVMSIVVETTERVLADRVAAAEREQLWTLSQDMLGRAGYDGKMKAVNPAWSTILGWPEKKILADPYADIVHPEDVGTTLGALAEMERTLRPARFENRMLTSQGQWKPIGWTVTPEPDGVHFIAVGRDLSEDKQRERELREAQDALRQSQKMEAVGQLTGGIAHDFNNLLAGISGNLELLELRLGQGRTTGLERYISVAQDASRRAAALTQRLLAFSRRQTLDPKPIDVNRLVAGMEDLIRRTIGPAITLEVVGAGGLWLTRIDSPQLENALLNLTINARDSISEGGRITIETANKWLDDRAAKERDLPPGQYISLCVTDTGTGMAPDVIAKAFDPFFTTKPLGQGTGLGLSMIHGFVRQSGGQVRIYSETGKGSTLCLYLPRFSGAIDVEGETGNEGSFDQGQGETILVIDDEDSVRNLVTEVLADTGYSLLEARDGPSGLKILQSERPIDLLVTDVGLPGGLNGRQIADAARVSRPGLKVLFITGYAENAAVGNGLLDMGMEIITKPFNVLAFGNKVREMLDH